MDRLRRLAAAVGVALALGGSGLPAAAGSHAMPAGPGSFPAVGSALPYLGSGTGVAARTVELTQGFDRLPPGAAVAHTRATAPGHPDLQNPAEPGLRPSDVRGPAALLSAAADELRARGVAVVAPQAGVLLNEPEPQGSWADALGLGDVDGDGAADVGILDISLPDYSLTLRAVRGPDGTQLWSTPLEAAGLVVAQTDLTGDGADDLIRFAIPRFEVLVEDCPPQQWHCNDYRAEFEWEVSVLSGRDLATAWSSRWNGRVLEEYRDEQALTERRITYRFEVRNGWILPDTLPHGEGIGVLVNAWDLDDRWAYTDAVPPVVVPDTFSTSVRTTDHLSVHRGTDGAVLARSDAAPVQGYTRVEPAADVDGDGYHDVLVLTSVRTDTAQSCTDLVLTSDCTGATTTADHALALLDGRTLQQRWSRASGGAHGAGGVLDADVSGDGVPDVAHRWFTPPPQSGGQGSFGTDVLSGADGRTLWRVDAYTEFCNAGDLTGDGRQDVLQTQVTSGAGEATLTLTRRSGADGTVLFSTSHRLGDQGAQEAGYVYPADDQDGDGHRDVVVGRITYRVDSSPSGEPVLVPDHSTALVESIATGAPAWQVTGTGERTLLPLGRLDGNQVIDFDWSVLRAEDSQFWFDVDIRTGGGGGVLWSRQLATPFGYVTPVGDADHDGLGDVAIVHDEQQGNVWLSRVLAVRGLDGSQRWAVRSQP